MDTHGNWEVFFYYYYYFSLMLELDAVCIQNIKKKNKKIIASTLVQKEIDGEIGLIRKIYLICLDL
jgi:hypothetical protein